MKPFTLIRDEATFTLRRSFSLSPVPAALWLVAEDALERFVVRRIGRRIGNRFVRIVARLPFNPTRSSANLPRFEKPWRRDR